MLIRFRDDENPNLSQFGLLCNRGESELFSNVAANSAKPWTRLVEHEANAQPAIICGSGPSLADTLESIRELQKKGGKVFALNNAAKFLVESGIKVDAQVLIDPREFNAQFVSERWATEAYLCSQMNPAVFEAAAKAGYEVTLWHPNIEGIGKYIPEAKPLWVSATLTVGLSCLSLIHTLGHREFHLFGYDSSHKEDKSHAFSQPQNAADEIVRCVVPPGEVFYSSMTMAGQANDFKHVADMLKNHGVEMHVHGSGLIPFLWRQWEKEKNEKILTACYDLGVSPPSYDFLSFLIEAERHRRTAGHDAIDVVFQPGPMHGFRDDDLPPDTETRKGMLWRVCVAMAKLLPSVRNVEVLAKRRAVTGDVFPVEWEHNRPKAHYATAYLKNGEPLLKASELARRRAAKRFTKPYATISLRQALHWPDRNSNIAEWVKVAQWLRSRSIVPVFIPDADGISPDGFECSEAAAWDLDMRAALYEGAEINLGVLNGPMSLCAFIECRYLIFNVVVESAIASSTAFLKAHGFNEGDGFGGNGKLIWQPDTAENILPQLVEFDRQPEKTS